MAKILIIKTWFLINAVFLAIIVHVFVTSIDRVRSKRIMYSIPVSWADPDLYKEYPEVFVQLPPGRIYRSMNFTGNQPADAILLQKCRPLIRKILFSKDTINGIHFTFGNEAQYGSFVKVLDILRLENAKSYIPYQNNLWFLCLPPRSVDTTRSIEGFYL